MRQSKSTTASDAKRENSTTGSSNTATKAKDRNYPDHAILHASKDQLKSMPEFKYSK